MKTKRLLGLLIAVLFCVTSVGVFADEVAISADGLFGSDSSTQTQAPADKADDDTAMESDDEPTEEAETVPEEDQEGEEEVNEEVDEGVDYSDASNWAYWKDGENKQADLFFVCPTVDSQML